MLLARTLPVKIGNEEVNFARDNFRKEGFMDGSLKNTGNRKKNAGNRTQEIEHRK